jgi:hypothetical protein
MLEITVFVGSGMQCPFTAAAILAQTGRSDDTFFPNP